jgi:hypothetical protein
MEPMDNYSSFILPDGRALAYTTYGDPSGTALFYFHGYPGCRLQAKLHHQDA